MHHAEFIWCILNYFKYVSLCAEDNLIESTSETENIYWIRAVELRQMLNKNPDKIFFMHINALKNILKCKRTFDGEVVVYI